MRIFSLLRPNGSEPQNENQDINQNSTSDVSTSGGQRTPEAPKIESSTVQKALLKMAKKRSTPRQEPNDDDSSSSGNSLNVYPDAEIRQEIARRADKSRAKLPKYEKHFGFNYKQLLTGKRRNDRLMFLFHFFMLVQSMSLVTLGLVLRFFLGLLLGFYVRNQPSWDAYSEFVVSTPDKYNMVFAGYVQDIGVKLIIINLLFAFAAIVYISFGMHRFVFTIPTMVITCGIAIVMETTFSNITYSRNLSQNEKKIEELRKKMKDQYKIFSDDDFSVAYDYFSLWLECCGIVDQYDFTSKNKELVFSRIMEKDLVLQVPPVCCTRHLFMDTPAELRQDKIINNCARSSRHVYKGGCFGALGIQLESLVQYYIVVVFTHILDCLIHINIYTKRISIFERALRFKFSKSRDEKTKKKY